MDEKEELIKLYLKMLVQQKWQELDFLSAGDRKNIGLIISDNHTEGTLILKTITNQFDFGNIAVLLIFVLYIVVFMKFYIAYLSKYREKGAFDEILY